MPIEMDHYRFNKKYLNALDKMVAHLNGEVQDFSMMGSLIRYEGVTEFLNTILYPLRDYYKICTSNSVPTHKSRTHVLRLSNALSVKQPEKLTLGPENPIHYVRVVSDFYGPDYNKIEYMDINVEYLIYIYGKLKTVEGLSTAFNKYLFHRHSGQLVQIWRHIEKWMFMNI